MFREWFATASGVMTDPQTAHRSDADDVERHLCPHCKGDPGLPCRSRFGASPIPTTQAASRRCPGSPNSCACRPRPTAIRVSRGDPASLCPHRPTRTTRALTSASATPASRPGRLVFAFFAAMAGTEREDIREPTLEGPDRRLLRPPSQGSAQPCPLSEDLPGEARRRVSTRVVLPSSSAMSRMCSKPILSSRVSEALFGAATVACTSVSPRASKP